MKKLFLLGFLAVLNLSYCSRTFRWETANITSYLNRVPFEIVHEIAYFLDDSFHYLKSVNRHCRKALSALSIRSFLKKHFGDLHEIIPEDVANCESELKFLLPLARLKNRTYVCEALKSEIESGHKINVLLPQLINYINAKRPNLIARNLLFSVMDRKRYDILFQNWDTLFKGYLDDVFSDFYRVQDLMEYIIMNPQHLYCIHNYFQVTFHYFNIINWNMAALIANAPDSILYNFPEDMFRMVTFKPNIWNDTIIPKEHYPNIFDRINQCDYIRNSELYRLLNLIRFGPEDADIYENQIQYRDFTQEQTLLLCKCASRSNKMNLFAKLIGKCKSLLENLYAWLNNGVYLGDISRDFEMHKFEFDVHEFFVGDDSFRQILYRNTRIIDIISKFYQVTMVDWSQNNLHIEFKTTIIMKNGYAAPEIIIIDRKFDSNDELLECIREIPYRMNFVDISVLEKFISHLFKCLQIENETEVLFNGENLKLIATSQATCAFVRGLLNEFRNCRFVTFFSEILKVVDKPVLSLTGIVTVKYNDLQDLVQFKAFHQLQRLEALLGISVAQFSKIPDNDRWNYYKYRNIFKYLIITKQEISKELKDIFHNYLKADFPKMF